LRYRGYPVTFFVVHFKAKSNDDPARRFLIEDNRELTSARLELAAAIGQILRNGLGIMGVTAAEEMQ